VAFTGNMICGVWFGNDDYAVMHQMTGGSLPAMTWHEIMAYAHQGIELKPIPGLGPQAPSVARAGVAEGKKEGDVPASRPTSVLTKRGADALVRVERLMDEATRVLAIGAAPTNATDAQGASAKPNPVASASER
jgi:penicillin-binding protein 1A